MTDLLVSSLMADGGLRTALQAAIRMEIKELEEVAEKPSYSEEELLTEQAQLEAETKRAAAVSACWEDDRAASIPLLYLVRQLMKNSAAQSLARLNALLFSAEISASSLNAASLLLSTSNNAAAAESPSLRLLVKFQRLLMAELYAASSGEEEEEEGHLSGLLSLLRKYLQYLCTHLLELLPVASSMAALGQRHFLVAAAILGQELLGILLPELTVCLLLLQVKKY
jgi:E3 ubiquitin-protein ligase HERC2